jgi:excinuclease ABC subunit C
MFDIKEELKHLPEQPGVYLMHDKSDTVIYVGKAKVLKNRVRQYFQNSAAHTPKVRAMVSNIDYFEYIVTDSEIEALVLECNLIKKYQPKYNILLKDDKQYPYIKVTINEDYPKVFMTRRLQNDGAKYYGPYMGTTTIYNTLDIIQNIFNPPTCARRFPQDIGKGRPCLNYHIKKCFAPCMGNMSREEYRKVFFEICSFLDGDHKDLIREMEERMKEASLNMQYEKAASLRDKISSVRAIEEKQKIINSKTQIDEDIIALEIFENKAFVEVFFVRSGKVIGRENYRLDKIDDMTGGQIMTDFVKQFYSNAVYVPPVVLLEYEIEDRGTIEEWLEKRRTTKVHIQIPKRGEKRRLVEMVKKNAFIAVTNYRANKQKEDEKNNAAEKLANLLGMNSPLHRIESYDISNISGSDNVAAMIVFTDGKPDKKMYRKFKIKSFEGANDYAAMQEVLYRRFRRAIEEQEQINDGELATDKAKFLPMPDALFIDGGIGHVNAVCEIMEQMDLQIPVYGMVKDDKHRTRGMISQDGEIDISPISAVFNLVTRIQDEVHRFAITYHRKTRGKSAVKSELDDIPGIGAKRRAALLEYFKSLDALKKADADEIANVQGMNYTSAQAVWDYFNLE